MNIPIIVHFIRNDVVPDLECNMGLHPEVNLISMPINAGEWIVIECDGRKFLLNPMCPDIAGIEFIKPKPEEGG